MRTIVHQSYREDNVPDWIEACLASVQHWTQAQGYHYVLTGDEIFDLVPEDYRRRAAGTIPIMTDLGRLQQAKGYLQQGYDRTIWLDADLLIFNPDDLVIDIVEDYAFGREVWAQLDKTGKLKIYRNVHNAVSVFCKDNSFLDFYIHAAERIVSQMEPGAGGGLAPQVVGPKLLTSLYNTLNFSLVETVGMFSPLVLGDVLSGGGDALDKTLAGHTRPLTAANLCSSLANGTTDGVCLNDQKMMDAVKKLLALAP